MTDEKGLLMDVTSVQNSWSGFVFVKQEVSGKSGLPV